MNSVAFKGRVSQKTWELVIAVVFAHRVCNIKLGGLICKLFQIEIHIFTSIT